MKNAVIIILFDHLRIHTADYAAQTCEYVRNENIVIGVLMKDAKSIKENLVSGQGLWILRKQRDNYYLYKPLYIIPFKRFRFIEQLNIACNIALIRIMVSWFRWQKKSNKTYVWVFSPEHYPVASRFTLPVRIIYDCVDYHGDGPYAKMETRLLKISSTVVVNSHALYKLHRRIRPDVHIVPSGFDLAGFSGHSVKLLPRLPHDKPLITYVGGINSRLDFRILIPLISGHPEYRFIFVGPVQIHESDNAFVTLVKPTIDTMFRLPNVRHFSVLERNAVQAVIRQSDICMVPYDVSRFYNRFSFPMKVFEYFYEGKPVIATPIAEFRRFPKYVKTGKTAQSWEKHISSLFSAPWPISYQKEQRRLAIQNSWENTIDAIVKVLI